MIENRKEKIAIVDPFFSGSDFRYMAEALNYEVICIQSSPSIQPKSKTASFSYCFIFNDNLDEILNELKPLNVKAVFAGCENGVLLADVLSEKLGLITNGTALSLARRDKSEMKKVFNENEVPCAKFIELSKPCVEDVLDWMVLTNQQFPIVLKPAMGFGSYNVFICYNQTELATHLNHLSNQDFSLFGIESHKILAEEYIDGEEYCINLFGNGSDYFVTDVWKYDRREYTKGRNAYYSIDLVDPYEDFEFFLKMIDVSLQSAKCLGIQYGCATVELKINTKNEIKILEVGARIVGAHLAEHAKNVSGQNLELATINAFLGNQPQLEKYYTMQQQACTVVLIAKESGIVEEIYGVDKIMKLASFKKLYLHIDKGQEVAKTVDLITTPGLVQLQSDDKAQIEKDRKYCHDVFHLQLSSMIPA